MIIPRMISQPIGDVRRVKNVENGSCWVGYPMSESWDIGTVKNSLNPFCSSALAGVGFRYESGGTEAELLSIRPEAVWADICVCGFWERATVGEGVLA